MVNKPNTPAAIKDDPEAVDKYLFYIHARDQARGILLIICREYEAGYYADMEPDLLEFIDADLELLFNELAEAERLLYNRSLSQ